jgi:hypothetical protein
LRERKKDSSWLANSLYLARFSGSERPGQRTAKPKVASAGSEQRLE